jgi:hypothetical protein
MSDKKIQGKKVKKGKTIKKKKQVLPKTTNVFTYGGRGLTYFIYVFLGNLPDQSSNNSTLDLNPPTP